MARQDHWTDPQDADDDRTVEPEPELGSLPDDPEVPEGDAIEQAEEVVPAGRVDPPTRDVEVPEADAWEQSLEVPFDDDRDDST